MLISIVNNIAESFQNNLLAENRLILRNAMLRHGFEPIDSEWWHFTLRNEPFPDTYFDFPIRQL